MSARHAVYIKEIRETSNEKKDNEESELISTVNS